MADTRSTRGTPPGGPNGGPSRPPAEPEGQDEVDVDEFARTGAEAGEEGTGSHVCSVAFCPISMALSAVEGAKPDAVEHLLAAGREFLLATRAVLDATAAQAGRGSTKLEKIDID
jgi:hypothetical protein